MKTALISVYNKEGIAEFARELVKLGFDILASGGTAKELSSAGIKVTDVASLVGGGAILGHRVVTLSREVHAGLLARDTDEDRKELNRLKIPWIDLVCVDLYPLQEEIVKWDRKTLTPTLSQREREQTIAEERDAIIEKTDIGGPTMIRSAAKGRRIVVCDPTDRMDVISWLKSGEPDKENFISSLVAKAEAVVADYCLVSARYHSAGKYEGMVGRQIAECKYGENGYQTPVGLYEVSENDELSLSKFQLMAGTEPSYNNWADVDRLLQTITHIAAGIDLNQMRPAPSSGRQTATFPQRGKGIMNIAVGVKHGNPCGAAVSGDPSLAIKKMLEGDLRAIFGGLVMVNFSIDEKLAEILLSHRMSPTTPSPDKSGATPPQAGGEKAPRRLLDGIIAPEFSPAAIEMLKRKGDKCRFLINPALGNLSKDSLDGHRRFRYVRGGFLAQPNYTFLLDLQKAEIVGNKEINEIEKSDLVLAWAIGSTSNSNTVTIVKNNQLLGNGVGQQDRVGCCQLAIKRATDAGHSVKGAAAYSDSFFPFVDGVQTLADAGISAIFATSGSVRDREVKNFCKERNIALYLVPDSEARGFFGH